MRSGKLPKALCSKRAERKKEIERESESHRTLSVIRLTTLQARSALTPYRLLAAIL
jgi:hypothetical protein